MPEVVPVEILGLFDIHGSQQNAGKPLGEQWLGGRCGLGDRGERPGKDEHPEVIAEDRVAGQGKPVWRRALAGVQQVTRGAKFHRNGLRTGLLEIPCEVGRGRFAGCRARSLPALKRVGIGRITARTLATLATLADDLPDGFSGELDLEDGFNLPGQHGAVIGASFAQQLHPAPNDIPVDDLGALLIRPAAQHDARKMARIAGENGEAPRTDGLAVHIENLLQRGGSHICIVKAANHHFKSHVLVIVRHDLEEFESVENVDGRFILGEVEAETGIALVAGKDQLEVVVEVHV